MNIDERANHLLSMMTLEEKVAQIGGMWSSELIDKETKKFDKSKAVANAPHGIGHISRIGAVSLLPPHQSAELANTIQSYFVNDTRLGIPAIVHEENCAGYMANGATSFPQAIGLAATFEPDLIRTMTDAIRKQMRSVGAHHGLAPVLDVARDPRWGRVEETFGEDPFLISAFGIAYVNGLQSDDWKNGILATAKHFLGYGLSEGGMNWAPAQIPLRLLREVYLTPFAAVIKHANVASVMNAYQEIDGIPCGSSQEFLVDMLRWELGFKGTIVADYFTINMLVDYHRVAKNKAEAAKYALTAGIDVELPANDCYGQPLIDAINAGEIRMDLVDVCVGRVLTQKMQVGIFDNPYVDTGRIAEVYNTPDQIELSRTLASKSVVLLKNDNAILPLSKSIKKIAVIGPSADNARLMQADYHYPSHLEGVSNMGDNMVAPTPNKENR
ncbi:MAG TPA: glycoside hydrolase family 3 protein, partial [Aggregatilineales bacterium]|nr:glycoside hydrolase family 3 protein [Aggregatilineales bacterium]